LVFNYWTNIRFLKFVQGQVYKIKGSKLYGLHVCKKEVRKTRKDFVGSFDF